MFSLNKGRSLASFQKQTRVSRITILKRFFFAKPASKIIFPTFVIFLFLGFFQSCGTTKQIEIYNPFPDKDIPMKLNSGMYFMVRIQLIQSMLESCFLLLIILTRLNKILR